MHLANPLLQLCVFASAVSAFYPYIPDYKCIKDGDCADASKRGLRNEVVDSLAKKGSFEVKIKQTKSRVNGLSYTERTPHYVEHRFEKRDSTYSLVPSKETTLPNSAAIDQDGQDLSYTAVMKFGSSGKELNMLLDSGAATTWVMGDTCTDTVCTIHNTFGKADSTTFVNTSSPLALSYGTGSVMGNWANDTIDFAGFKIPFGFGVANQVSDQFNSYPMDGILGLAVLPGNDHPGFLSTLISQGLLKQAIFSVNLNRGADGTNDGEIVFGATDSSKFTGSISYSPVNTAYPGQWMITLGDAGFNGKSGGLAGKRVVIDTGTSYIFLPPLDAKKFYSTFSDAVVSSTGDYYTVPCDTTTPAQFTLGGVTYEVSSDDWVGGEVDGGRCTSNIYSRDATGIGSWLMGDTFLKNVYTVFDVGNNQIGFAKKSVSSSSSTSSSTSSKSTGTFSATAMKATQTPSTDGGFTGLTSGDDEASASTTAAATATPATNPEDSGAASLSTTSLGLFAAAIMASLALVM